MLRTLFPSARRNLGLIAGLAVLAIFGGGVPGQDGAAPKADRNGDALPEGALARLGTLRWRHGDAVTFVAFVQDGKAILTGGLDNTLRLWDAASGKEIRRFDMPAVTTPAMKGMVIRQRGWAGAARGSLVALSRDGKTLAIPAGDSIQLVEVDSGKEIRKIKLPLTGASAIAFSPDGKTLAAKSGDSAVYLFGTDDGKEIRQIKGMQVKAGGVRVLIGGGFGAIVPLAFSADGKTIATTESEFDQANMKVIAVVRISSVENGDEVRKIDAAPNGAGTVVFAADGKTLAFATLNSVHLHEAETGKEIRQIDTPNGAVALVFMPGSKVLAARGRDQVVRLYNLETGKEVHQLGDATRNLNGNVIFFSNGASGDAHNLAVSADGKTIATGSGNTIRLFDAETGKEKPLPTSGKSGSGHRGPVSTLGASADGKTLVSRGADGVIRRWDLTTGEELGNFREPANTASVAVSPDAKMIAFGGIDAMIRLYDTTTGKQAKDVKGHPNGTAALLFSPDGKTLASHGAADNTIRIHDVAKGTQVQQMVLQADAPAGNPVVVGRGFAPVTLKLAFSADSKTLIAQTMPGAVQYRVVNNQVQPVAGAPGSLKLWDIATGKQIRNIPLPANEAVGSVTVSPDSRLVATETGEQTVSIWEIASGKRRARLGNPEVVAKQPGPAMMPAFVVAGGNFGGIRSVDHGSTVAFSPDGALLACRNADKSIRVHEVVSGKEIGRFKGHEGAVTALAFTADGKRLASASNDTTVLVWDVASLKRDPASGPLELKAEEVADTWRDLVGEDGDKAVAAIVKLGRGAKQAVPFLSEQIKPAVPADPKLLARLIADLDSEEFDKRSGALEELERIGDLAMPALEKALAAQPTLETRRRVEPLLAKLTGGILSAEQVRVVRAIEALERANTPEARQLLQALADGAPGALPTREAQKVLGRISK